MKKENSFVKRIMSITLIMSFCMSFYCPFTKAAYKFPDKFWALDKQYQNALKNKDYNNIRNYGMEIVNMLMSETECKETINTIVWYSNEAAKASAALGDYDYAVKAYTIQEAYANKDASSYAGLARNARAYINQYTSDIRLYTDGGSITYYGAKNEHRNGVLFGACADSEVRNDLDNESMMLVYQELGQAFVEINRVNFEFAKNEGIAIQFALNCPNKALDFVNIESKEKYLAEISDLFASYPEVPVYLRFAAEFDVWDIGEGQSEQKGNEFKKAFQYVSDYFKQRNSNVAMVWCPTHASNANVKLSDFYPGDSYVDWVGISTYANRYFQGNVNASDEAEVLFKTGANSNPVIAVKDIVEAYGSYKPIMISEMGCGHYVKAAMYDATDFAVERLQQYHAYLPMVYPQIKLISYFDQNVSMDMFDYRLSSNPILKKEYLRLTAGGRFIQDRWYNSVDLCYREINDGTGVGKVFPVSCYVHKYNDTINKVTYYIDGKYAATSTQIPFTEYIDATGLGAGNHTLKAVAEGSRGSLEIERTINVAIYDNRQIKVRLETNAGTKVLEFDQPPVTYNDRTMVPMRKIFEELGAEVSWDDSTQTATGIKGGRNVRVTIGKYEMFVNDEAVRLDAPPIILGGRTLVPVRAVAEGLGCSVGWNEENATVEILQNEA